MALIARFDSTPRTLLFDLDGTLTDPGVGITRCIRYAMEQMGGPLEETEACTRFIGPPLQRNFAHLLGPDRTVMIGDRGADMEGARANGVRTIGVTYGYGSRDELEAAGAERMVSAPSELPAAVRSLDD